MRRSLGGSRRMGGGGGGGMLRTVHRSVRTGVGGASQEPFSHSTTTTSTTRPTFNKPSTSNAFSLSSSTTPSNFSSYNLPISTIFSAPTWPSCPSPPPYTDEFEWECIDRIEDERENGFYDDIVFGSVPSADEVQNAVSSLQRVLDPAYFSQFMKDQLAYNKDVGDQVTSPTGDMRRVSSDESELYWIEPSLHLDSSRMLQPHGSDGIYDAFHLLQTEPSIQRMVVSLSSDKAVWQAVLNNEVVQELRESLGEADKSVSGSSDEGSDDSNIATDILSWIIVNTKAKIMEVIEKITKLVDELFKPPDSSKTTGVATDSFEDKLRTSFLLSVIVLLIVVVTRATRA